MHSPDSEAQRAQGCDDLELVECKREMTFIDGTINACEFNKILADNMSNTAA